ncbi:LOW QUALITY PROTEIN: zinc finger protein 800-like [Leucoraja erinacea]|uniref:LOW QUALITY PROTEIN: zinc finger protein 800-like n=1 Tax=Leucoraja erinaceus TaxID=7782 RepID=UPI002453AC53|nr:LOW QUALITY PROTEIN: zinc finger protein 800-like [Leucoraja erinacea]
MERANAALRKRSQYNNQIESDIEENKLRVQKTPLKDKCCQTDIHHYGCCGPAYVQEIGDPPLLQQQLPTSKSGIQQIIECFRTGTTQLKHLLLKEVDTIFECKLCRSLFRGLPNLITHKEFYCFQSQKINEHFPDSSNKQNQAIRELLEAIYPRADNQDFIIKLEPIESNKNAVFQHVTRVDDPAFNAEPYSAQTPSPVLVPEPEVEQVVPVEEPRVVSSIPAEVAKKKGAAPPLPVEESAGPADAKADTPESSSLPPHLICCICGKSFNSRRSVRRHIRKVHKKKMEELKKYIGTKSSRGSCQSLSSSSSSSNSNSNGGGNNNRVWSRTMGAATTSTNCPVCSKFFASKANVRRHFDEVHRGLRRDCITHEVATKPGQPLSLEESPPEQPAAPAPRKRKPPSSSSSTATTTTATSFPKLGYSLAACKCLLCKRTYSSPIVLRRHMVALHKITLAERPIKGATEAAAPSGGGDGKVPGTEAVVAATVAGADTPSGPEATPSPTAKASAPQGDPKSSGRQETADKSSGPLPKHKGVKQENDGPRAASPAAAAATVAAATGQSKAKKPKLSMGFDFKQLYCKLCKRQFTSKQNLTKHIKMHTDGNNIYVKFYKCPLCDYETRRKRDVVRHVTVVHKKSTRYLGKIIANLESRAVKKPIEFVLNRAPKRGPQRDEGRALTAATIKTEGASASTSPVSSPLAGRRSESLAELGTEVKFTKHFSLHKCTHCGKAFAKKTYLEHHKKTHRSTALALENKHIGRSTRSKALLTDGSR